MSTVIPPQGPVRAQINVGEILQAFNQKLFELSIVQQVLEEMILTHDFTKGNPTKEDVDIKIKTRAEEVEKQLEAQMNKNIIIAKQNNNLILPK